MGVDMEDLAIVAAVALLHMFQLGKLVDHHPCRVINTEPV